MDGEKRRARWRSKWLVAALALGAAALLALWAGPPPTITIETGLPGIGKRTPVTVTFEEPSRGLGRLEVELVLGERVERLAETEHRPRPVWKPWAAHTSREVFDLEVGSETVPGLESGEATLRARAWPAPALLRRPRAVVEEVTLPVRLVPPSLAVVSRQHYPAPGGVEAVVYRVGEHTARDGVEVGDWWFPGFELPGGQGERFALFSLPFDATDAGAVRLVAEDDVRNRAERAFVDRFLPKRYETDTIELDDRFLERVVPAIMGSTPGLQDRGGLLENYLQINRELRERNAAELIELAGSSRSEFLWSQAFLPMPNAQVMSAFADRRTYVYQGREVDRQDHLGFDLASVRRAEIPAANRGVVVLARYFGIYGNAVAIDHGYGLMSLCGHLSSIEVAEGDAVERGQTIGRSGETGLAGGDHLHFTMLLQGRAVTPVEWWDAGWIRDRLALKLGAALPFDR